MSFKLQGPRDYVDIAQISYRVLEALHFTPLNKHNFGFKISVERPLGTSALIKPIDAVLNEDILLAQFEIQQNQSIQKFGLVSLDSSLPNPSTLLEPRNELGIDYRLESDKIYWTSLPKIEWPVFYAYMVLGRLAGIHFFGGHKPKGLSYYMNQIPPSEEAKNLWVRKKRGPIKGLGVIELGWSEIVIGESVLKI